MTCTKVALLGAFLAVERNEHHAPSPIIAVFGWEVGTPTSPAGQI